MQRISSRVHVAASIISKMMGLSLCLRRGRDGDESSRKILYSHTNCHVDFTHEFVASWPYRLKLCENRLPGRPVSSLVPSTVKRNNLPDMDMESACCIINLICSTP